MIKIKNNSYIHNQLVINYMDSSYLVSDLSLGLDVFILTMRIDLKVDQ